MFKGATIGSDIIMGSLGAEMGTGQIELVAGELAILGAVIAFRKIKGKVENKRDRKHNEQDQRNSAEEERQRQLQEQADRQAELDRQMQEAEAERQRQQAAAEAERQRVLAEQAAEAERQRQANIDTNQTALNQQRLQENQADIRRAQDYVVREENQMEYQRERRINQDLSNIQPYEYRAPDSYNWWDAGTYDQIMSDPVDVEYQAAMDLLRGPGFDQPPTEAEQAQLDRYRAQAEERKQAQNPPDGDPDSDDEPNGGGMPSGPGGGPGRPDNGGNGRLPDRGPNNDQGRGYKKLNPYADILSEIAKQIQNQKNKEKKSVEQATDQPPVTPDTPAQPSTGIIGGNPATWTPITSDPSTQEGNYPGKNGSGTLRPVPIEQEKKGQAGLDNAHITQQELEAIIGAQGNAELTNEEQLAQLELIDQKMSKFASVAQARTVKLAPSSVFSGSVTRF